MVIILLSTYNYKLKNLIGIKYVYVNGYEV